MNSRGFNRVLFSSEDRKRRQKKEQTRRVKRWQKAGRGQKAHCKGQKCPRKGGERKESHHWLVPRTHCKRRGVQPRMTDVPGHCYPSSLLSASCSGSGIPWDGLRLWESFNAPCLSHRVPRRHPDRALVCTETLKVRIGLRFWRAVPEVILNIHWFHWPVRYGTAHAGLQPYLIFTVQ